MDGTSEWRVDDAAAYDAVRASATTEAASLAQAGNSAAAARVLRSAAAVDGFDRVAVDSLAVTLAAGESAGSRG